MASERGKKKLGGLRSYRFTPHLIGARGELRCDRADTAAEE
jgi:hypothetical protein